MNNADDHMRMIKGVLKNTFPGVNVPLTRTTGSPETFAGFIAPNGLATAPAYSFLDEPTLGLYRSASGRILITGGQLTGNGAVPVGSLHSFLVPPTGLVTTGIAGGQYLELNGATYNVADYPGLAAALQITGSTFKLTDVTDTGRFLRSRSAAVPANTTQANALKTHAVNSTGTTAASGSHAHNVSGSTGFMDRAQAHDHGTNANAGATTTGGGEYPAGAFGGATVFGADTNHAHAVSGSTDAQGQHAHNVVVTGTVTGETETRPESLSVIICIKT